MITRLLLNRDYARFWLSQVLTSVASKSMTMVFPLLATLSFAATPFEVGVVTAAQYVPVLVVTLFVGVWLDRRPRRPTLLFTDVAGGLVLLVVPVLGGLDEFHLGVLYAVAFGFGSLVAIAEVCAQAYLPSLVGESDLLPAIGRLEAVFTLVVVAAPGLGGLLMNWLGGPGAVLTGAVCYLIAALVLMTVTRREPPVPAPAAGEGTFGRIAAGARFLLTVPVLRTLIGQAALFNFFEQAMLTLYTVYAASVVGVTPALLGLTVTLGAVGSMLGAVAAEQAERRWGFKRVVVGSMAIASTAPVLIPLATRPTALTVTVWSVSFVLYGFGLTVYNVFSTSTRQRLTPERLRGRVAATTRLVAYGPLSAGTLLGGGLGSLFGARTGLWIAVALLAAAFLHFVRSMGRTHLPDLLPGPRPAVQGASGPADR
ncbi:MFS transporter [Streptomyces rubradiris]|uniref:MFS transporter n=1 Tax=Streptomyces rubradiris TaxID=285531 RepID=A0ABQ3RQW6_STRRR|nr:MFS transporter [Streptomyces rubradiris]GHH24677.1 MFS transporter [Streptomyces rubradiris]GHI58266.1 MFS transporter [Streptomyces rubradiris]